jgi:hypothetical protein
MAKNKKKISSIILLLSFSNAVELKSKSNEYFIPQAPWPQNFENL